MFCERFPQTKAKSRNKQKNGAAVARAAAVFHDSDFRGRKARSQKRSQPAATPERERMARDRVLFPTQRKSSRSKPDSAYTVANTPIAIRKEQHRMVVIFMPSVWASARFFYPIMIKRYD